MIRQTQSAAREEIVARALAPVVAELRLVDLADFAAFIRLEHRASLADILASAAELFFMPGTLRLGADAELDLAWGREARIALGLELWLERVTVFFSLSMDADRAGIDVSFVSFADPGMEGGKGTLLLEQALNAARIRRTSPQMAR